MKRYSSTTPLILAIYLMSGLPSSGNELRSIINRDNPALSLSGNSNYAVLSDTTARDRLQFS
jgi:hypothetical protein